MIEDALEDYESQMEKLSNDLKAALTFLEKFKTLSTYNIECTCHTCQVIKQAEEEYAKAISEGHDTSDVPSTEPGT